MLARFGGVCTNIVSILDHNNEEILFDCNKNRTRMVNDIYENIPSRIRFITTTTT